MSASQTLGGPSRCGRAIGPSLDKIIKNAAWRKHAHLVSSCKSVLDKLDSISDDPSQVSSSLFGLSQNDAGLVLHPIFLALDSAYPKVVEPALECAFKLFSLGLARGEIEGESDNTNTTSTTNTNQKNFNIIYKLIAAICKVCGIGEEPIELSVLRVLLSAVRSPCLLIRGDCLLLIVRTCYNVYLGGSSGTNQICAKSVLAQIMVIVFTRVEEDSMNVPHFKTVSVSELLEFADKSLNEGSSIHFCQNFINEVMGASEGVFEPAMLQLKQNVSTKLPNGDTEVAKEDEKGEGEVVKEGEKGEGEVAKEGENGGGQVPKEGETGEGQVPKEGEKGGGQALKEGEKGEGQAPKEGREGEGQVLKDDEKGEDRVVKEGEKGEGGEGQGNGGAELGGESKIREDGFLLFKNICKLSMKFSSQENPDDLILLRGKILSLELLKVVMDNGGPVWLSNARQVFVFLTKFCTLPIISLFCIVTFDGTKPMPINI